MSDRINCQYCYESFKGEQGLKLHYGHCKVRVARMKEREDQYKKLTDRYVKLKEQYSESKKQNAASTCVQPPVEKPVQLTQIYNIQYNTDINHTTNTDNSVHNNVEITTNVFNKLTTDFNTFLKLSMEDIDGLKRLGVEKESIKRMLIDAAKKHALPEIRQIAEAIETGHSKSVVEPYMNMESAEDINEESKHNLAILDQLIDEEIEK
jgi:hypothetical protein